MVFDQTFFAQVGPGWTGVDRGGPGVDRGGLGSIHDWSQIGGALCSQHPCSNCCGGHSLLWQLATVQQDDIPNEPTSPADDVPMHVRLGGLGGLAGVIYRSGRPR